MNTIYTNASGLITEGLDFCSKIGITLGATAAKHLKGDFPILSQSIFNQWAGIGGMQIYFDNINFKDHEGKQRNMTQPIINFERLDTSNMNTDEHVNIGNTEIFFDIEHMMIDGKHNKDLLDHLTDVAVNTMGRFIGDNFKNLNWMKTKEIFPLMY